MKRRDRKSILLLPVWHMGILGAHFGFNSIWLLHPSVQSPAAYVAQLRPVHSEPKAPWAHFKISQNLQQLGVMTTNHASPSHLYREPSNEFHKGNLTLLHIDPGLTQQLHAALMLNFSTTCSTGKTGARWKTPNFVASPNHNLAPLTSATLCPWRIENISLDGSFGAGSIIICLGSKRDFPLSILEPLVGEV